MADLLWSCGSEFLAVVCSTGVKVFDGRDGTCKFSHTFENEPQQSQANQDDISTLGHGVLCCFSNSGKLFALCNPQRELFIWQTSDWKLLRKREVVRRTTVIIFTNKEDYIIASNKGGDVYRFFIHDADKEKELLLGHVSMILDMALTRDDKYLITCDRDEKIRVSCYPNSYNIQSFCLGNLDFVSSLALLTAGGQGTLVSGGGDGYVRFWNPESGKQITAKMIDNSTDSTMVADQKGTRELSRKHTLDGVWDRLAILIAAKGFKIQYRISRLLTRSVREEMQRNKKRGVAKRRAEDLMSSPIISCIACCHKQSVVCILAERCRTVHLYHVSEREATSLPSLETNEPPWSAVFDPAGRLWCVQPYPEEPVLVFEPRGDSPNLTYAKLSSDFSPTLSSASDWNFLKGSLHRERKLEALRKKEVDNISEYLTRKEDRIGKKKNKHKEPETDNGYTVMDDSNLEKTEENEAKRPKLELAS